MKSRTSNMAWLSVCMTALCINIIIVLASDDVVNRLIGVTGIVTATIGACCLAVVLLLGDDVT